MNTGQNIEKLLPISNNNGSQAVNAKDLYLFLGYDKSQWSRWYNKNIIKNDFAEEGIDYQTFDTMSNGNSTKDFALSIDFAKELSMLARNEKGKIARKYFIACENKLKEQAKPKSHLEILVESAQALLEQSRRLDKVESRLAAMEQEREENTKLLLSVSVSQNELPTQTLRSKIIQLVNKYASSMNLRQDAVWHKIYEQLYYLFRISINNYKKLHKKERKLDIAERNNLLDKIYDIISNMVREAQIA